MTTKPRSFRLTPEAAANLERLAAEYRMSENKVVNILLTELIAIKERTLVNPTCAARILEDRNTDMVLNRLQKQTDALIENNKKFQAE